VIKIQSFSKQKLLPTPPPHILLVYSLFFASFDLQLKFECVYIVKMFVLLLAFLLLLLLLLFSLLRLVFPSLSSMSRHIDDVTDIY